MIALLLFSALASAATPFAGFKDDLFSYKHVIEDRGASLKIDYQEMRDINARDAVPVSRVRDEYVEVLPGADERRLVIDGVETYEAGEPRGARTALIFVHGGGGNGTLGFNDWTFGGNFNRAKHLMILNGGVYESISITSFDSAGLAQMKTLISHLRSLSPGVRVVVACGSMGGTMCWGLYDSMAAIDGVILEGGYPHPSQIVRRDVGVYIAHGSADPIYDWHLAEDSFNFLKKKRAPAKFVLFETGKHGTPIRMIDYRDALEFVLAARAQTKY